MQVAPGLRLYEERTLLVVLGALARDADPREVLGPLYDTTPAHSRDHGAPDDTGGTDAVFSTTSARQRWAVVESLDSDRVEHVARRFSEDDGVMRWVSQPIPGPSASPR